MPMHLHLVCVCGGPKSDPMIIEHFLRHYRDVVGVTDFHLFVHENPEFANRIARFGYKSTPITLFSEPIKTDLFNKVIASLGGEWCLTCDMDEFQDYGGPFEWFIKSVPPETDFVHGRLIDRFAREGFPNLPSEGLAAKFPRRTTFSWDVLGACNTKVTAVHGVLIGTGHHVCHGKHAFGPINIDHYKWDASIVKRLRLDRGNATSNNEAKTFNDLEAAGTLEYAIGACELPPLPKKDVRLNSEGYAFTGEEWPELFADVCKTLGPMSILDVGCGPCGAIRHFKKMGAQRVVGIDGSFDLLKNPHVTPHLRDLILVDLEKSPCVLGEKFDLVWSFEVAEHIANEENYLITLTENAGDFIVMTAAGPGQGGIHHVNCQPQAHWIKKLDERGFDYMPDLVEQFRAGGWASRGYMVTSGMVFRRRMEQ